MGGTPVPVRILMMQLIANLSPSLCAELGLGNDQRSIGVISADSDDPLYIALDEATKIANVQVVYAKSLYAGASNASTGFAGEVIGIIAGPTPSEVTSALNVIEEILTKGTWFHQVGETVYLAHCVSRTGTFLSEQAAVSPGEAIAYLVAPPVEAIVGLDAALKSADVRLATWFAPPTETNFAGGLLWGTQSACQAACAAFAAAVESCGYDPKRSGGN